MTISQRIFFELKKQKKSQKDLSLATGISTSTISAWNKNGANPSAEFICPIAKFLCVSLEYLLVGESDSSQIVLNENEKRLLTLFKQLDIVQQENVIARAELLAEQNEAEYNDKENVS